MKKMILGFLVFFLFTNVSQAASRYEILYDYIDATVLENGNLKMKELVVLKGSLQEFQKSIYYRNSRLEKHLEFDYSSESMYNATALESVNVSVKEFAAERVRFLNLFDSDYKELSKGYFLEDLKENGYIESSMQDGKLYRIYYPLEEGVVGFLFEYTLKDVVLLHQDVAEMNFLFFPPLEQEVSNFEIRLHLGDKVDYVKMWAHGDLSSEVSYLDDMAIATYSKLPKNTKVSFRVVFTSDVHPVKKTQLTSLKKILEIEEKKAKVIDVQKRQTYFAKKAIFMVDVVFLSCLILYACFVMIKYDKEYDISYNEEYIRDIEFTYGTYVVDAFWHKKIRKQAFLESLFSLILRRNIVLSKKSLQLELKSREDISISEEVLIDILFEKLGANRKVKEEVVLNFLQQISSNKSYENYYQRWVSSVQAEVDKEHFYEKNGLPIVSSVFFVLLSLFVLMSSMYFKVEFLFSLFNASLSFLFMIYTFYISKKTKYGALEFAKISALKKKIQDFNHKEDLKKLEQYFVYSMVFDLQDQFYKLGKDSYIVDFCHKYLKDVTK